MPFCTQCGKELRQGDRFCRYCGAPAPDVSVPPDVKAPPDGQGPRAVGTPPAGGEGGKRPRPAVVVIAVIAAAAVLALILALTRGHEAGPGTAGTDPGAAVTDPSGPAAEETDPPEPGPSDGAGGETPSPSPAPKFRAEEMAAGILRDILDQGVLTEASLNSPLVAMGDFNGDSVRELLAVYEAGQGSVQYELWRLDEAAGPGRLDGGELFMEVGGDNGTIGLVERSGGVYLALERSSPTGSSTDDVYTFWAWDASDPSPDFDHPVTMEKSSSFDDPDDRTYSYSYMGETVSESEYQERFDEFRNWTLTMNPFYGPGGGVMTFEDLLSALE